MRIAGSDITLASRHVSVERYERKESLKLWIGDQRPDFEGNRINDTVTLSNRGRADEAHARNELRDEADGAEKTEGLGPRDEESLEPRLELLKIIIEEMTGKKIRVYSLKDGQSTSPLPEECTKPKEAPQENQRAGWGMEYDLHESRYEFENTSFEATGVIKTADGKEISFDLGLVMEREHLEETSVSLRAGDAVKKDPLVINFSSTAAELSDLRFSFDIDADGTADQIATLGGGSGYLALDRNGDGVINDGSELFGPTTGEGFAELAAFDDDGNGWIDEGDAIFSRLATWSGGSDSELTSLKDSGVGAIYLGNVSTPFDLKGADNALLGSVRTTGIYVKENGIVGTVQQVDLAV